MEVSQINLEQLGQSVLSTLKDAADRIRQKHIEAGQKASGKTANSIRAEVNVGPTSIHGVIWGRAPFYDLEEGRGPGAGPKNFYRIILDWMHFKGIHGTPIPYKRAKSDKWQPKYTPEDRGDRTLAYFISRKIVNEGTHLYRHQESRPDIYSSEIVRVTETIENSVISVLGLEIKNINQRRT